MAKSDPTHHTPLEDVQGFFSGTVLCALGVQIFAHLGLITGQTAGLALLLSYVTGWKFGLIFFLINLPFYIFSYVRMGWIFTLKSFIGVAMLSVMTYFIPTLFIIESVDTLFGAILAGILAGFGLIVLFRHGGSLGGIGVVGLYVQDRFGFQAGWVQLIFDAILFAAAFLILDPGIVLYSLIGAVVLNVFIGINHRQDRYIAR